MRDKKVKHNMQSVYLLNVFKLSIFDYKKDFAYF